MSHEQEALLETLYKFLKTQGYRPVAYDSSGKKSLAKYAVIIEFDFIKDGVNYGTARLSIDGSNNLTVYIDDKITKSPGAKSDDGSFSWTQLMKYLRDFSFGKLSFEIKDTDDWEYDMAKRKDTEKLDEGYYPINKNTSYSDNVPNVKIRIQHSKNLGEGEQRYRNVARIFIENANGERFMLETKKPGIARVFARHVAEGGRPYDEKWNHINSLVEDYTKMAGFVRATKNGQFNESTQNLVNEGINHYMGLRETLHKLAGKKGYNNYFESWTPTLNEDSEGADLSEMFISSSLDPRIESAMPILAKLSRNVTEVTEMTEVTELDEWASSIIDEDLTPTGRVQVEKIVELLSDRLPVGPNADNVIPLLSDLNLEDSELTEILKDVANQDSDSDSVPAIIDWMENSNDHKLHAIVKQLNGEPNEVAEDFDDETSISTYTTGTSKEKTLPGQAPKITSDYESKTFARNPATGTGSYMIQQQKNGAVNTEFQKNVSKPWMDYTEKGGQGPMSKFKATTPVTEGPKEAWKLFKFAKGGGFLGGQTLGDLLGEEDQNIEEDNYDDAVSAFLTKGGEVQKGKTYKPRKSERLGGSRHIGGGGEKMKSSRTGIGSHPTGKAIAGQASIDEHVAEGSIYKKDQDLSSIPTQELEAFVRKHWGGGVPTMGQGESVKRAMRELRRRQKQGVAEGSDVTKLNDYNQWLDKVDELGAEKHVQKNRTTIIAQSWDGEKIGEFDTRANQGWVMSQDIAKGSLEEYGDTAKGQKMLTKVQKRATDRMIKADDKNRLEPNYTKRDLKTVRKNKDTADRAWERMSDLDEQGVEEGLKFHGGFPDVDHMPGAVHRNGDRPKGFEQSQTSKRFFSDKAVWEQAVNEFNNTVFDDNSEFTSRNGIKEIEANGHVWAKWSDKQNKGFIDMGTMSESVDEDLDANQKRAGQLGPTDKVTTGAILGKEPKSQKGLRGKLVGANESVDPLIAIRRLSGFEK